MGREIRMVPANWEHPRNEQGCYIPLYPGERYDKRFAEFEAIHKEKGLQAAIDECGMPPDKDDYMPNWPESERTHYMMYEDVSQGTPLSPACETPEELAHWLVDNNASACGNETATYEQWLAMIKQGWAICMVLDAKHGMRSGVAAAAENKNVRVKEE